MECGAALPGLLFPSTVPRWASEDLGIGRRGMRTALLLLPRTGWQTYGHAANGRGSCAAGKECLLCRQPIAHGIPDKSFPREAAAPRADHTRQGGRVCRTAGGSDCIRHRRRDSSLYYNISCRVIQVGISKRAAQAAISCRCCREGIGENAGFSGQGKAGRRFFAGREDCPDTGV